RVPAGSSGGTAAAVSANLGALGLGTDTGNSIRGPSSHNCLVGIRSTMGLTSRDGIIPLYLRNDIGGPIARTVEDAVRVLEVIAGYDPADPITAASNGKIPQIYTQFLDKDGLKGARLGVFRKYIDTETTDPQIKDLMEQAISDLKANGAKIVDPFVIPDFDELTKNIWCDLFHHDVDDYLASLGERAPYKNLKAIVESGLYSPYIEGRLKRALAVELPPEQRDPPCLDLYHDERNIAFRQAVLNAMEKYNVDAIIYPTWSNFARKVGDLESPAGDNSQYLSPHTGCPAITVPIGFGDNSLPAGMTFVGRLFAEPDLIRFAYAYEQATKHRKAPENFPELEN
ncbi:MAG: amidase family protein, partial [bacterium]